MGYAVAVGGVALASGLRVGLGDVDAPFITFFPVLILATLVGGPRPGLLAVALSALTADYLFLPPALEFVWTADAIFTLAVYAIVAAAMVGLVTLLNEAMDRLSRQSANVRQVLETEPTGLIAVGEDGVIALSNAAVERQFGYTKAELLGQKVEMLVPEDRRAGHGALRRNYQEQPVSRAMGAGRDLEGLRKDGTRMPVEIGLSPFEGGGHHGAIATITDISERKAAEHRQQILSNEIRHRGRNLLAVVQAMAAQIITSDRPAAESRKEFSDAINALARAHDLFLEMGGVVSLAKLVTLELAPFDRRVTIDVPDIPLTASAAQDFALIVHELAINALKHGALSVPDGRVSLTGQEDGRELVLVWKESGRPVAVAPIHRGFGQTILVNVAQGLCTEVFSDYAPDGFCYRLRAELARISTVVDLATWRSRSA